MRRVVADEPTESLEFKCRDDENDAEKFSGAPSVSGSVDGVGGARSGRHRISVVVQPRRHRMRKQQRRDSARDWVRSGAEVTVKAYSKRYGVDRYTAYEDLSAIGCLLPPSADQWARRPDPVPREKEHNPDFDGDEWWTVIDGRRFFVAGYTPGGMPYGIFEDECEP